jgi:glycosyltransferase involved in cell wall biosynthesis
VAAPLVAVNGRFLTMTATGVQRYAREILVRIDEELDATVRVIVPPDRVLAADSSELWTVEQTGRWHGVRGHAWEQVALPRLVRRARADLLWSPCNWGPVATRRQVPVIHDVAPLVYPEYFTPAYRGLARLLTKPLVRRAEAVATPSSRVRDELLERFSLAPDRVTVVPPGVGAPFTSVSLDDLGRRDGRYCVHVGAHDSRKNVDFLLELWPDVHARTGLELHLAHRRVVTASRPPALANESAGIVEHLDPTDDDLADLYAGALCLLWPSHYEGYGFPLLEAMAAGTPFLAANVGAAVELAVDPGRQILPLDRGTWIERIEEWSRTGVGDLREESARRARAQTWEASAARTARLLDDVAHRS